MARAGMVGSAGMPARCRRAARRSGPPPRAPAPRDDAGQCTAATAPPRQHATAPRPRAYAGGGPWRTRVANQYVLTYLPSSCTSMRMPSRRFPATLPLSHTYALYPRPLCTL